MQTAGREAQPHSLPHAAKLATGQQQAPQSAPSQSLTTTQPLTQPQPHQPQPQTSSNYVTPLSSANTSTMPATHTLASLSASQSGSTYATPYTVSSLPMASRQQPQSHTQTPSQPPPTAAVQAGAPSHTQSQTHFSNPPAPRPSNASLPFTHTLSSVLSGSTRSSIAAGPGAGSVPGSSFSIGAGTGAGVGAGAGADGERLEHCLRRLQSSEVCCRVRYEYEVGRKSMIATTTREMWSLRRWWTAAELMLPGPSACQSNSRARTD